MTRSPTWAFGAIAIKHGWLGSDWLVLIAVAPSCSFILSAPLNSKADRLYARCRKLLRRFEHPQRLPEDEVVSLAGARVVILDMGRVGSGAYDYLKTTCGDTLLGIDSDPGVVAHHQAKGRRVILGDATNPDFTSRIDRESGNIELALVTLSNHRTNLDAIAQPQQENFKARSPPPPYILTRCRTWRLSGWRATTSLQRLDRVLPGMPGDGCGNPPGRNRRIQ